jgi:uncharacterized glyoxalase superfamily protein PhnB
MTQPSYKPTGAPDFMPYIGVSDPKASLAFFEETFGFERTPTVIEEGGKIMHAEMKFLETVIMFGPVDAFDPPVRTPRQAGAVPPVGFYVYCKDVDALFLRAKQTGAHIVSVPKDQFYGDRNFTVEDRDGYRWTFGQKVFDFNPSAS